MLQKTLNLRLSPAVLDIVFYMFGDSAGQLDGPAFVDVMKRRNRVPGYKVICQPWVPAVAIIHADEAVIMSLMMMMDRSTSCLVQGGSCDA